MITMSARRWLYVLAGALVVVLAILGPRVSRSSPPPQDVGVPEEALAALREGRYLRASEVMRDYLATHGDSAAPGAVLFAAQAEAGLGDWERVEQLLRDKPWLDSIGSGRGWDLLGRSQLQLGHFDQSSRSFSRYLEIASNVGDRQQGIAEIRKATAFVNTAKYDSALAAYGRASGMLPQIGDWIRIFSASAAASDGDTTRVRTLLDSADGTLARDWGWRSRVRAKQNAKDTAGALSAAQLAATFLPGAGGKAEAWLRTGELRLSLGDTAGARAAWVSSMTVSPGSSAALSAAQQLTDLNIGTARDNLVMGRVYLRHGNASRGIAGLASFMNSNSATASERRTVQLEMGRAMFNAGRYPDAATTLLAYADSAGNNARAADASYTAIRALYRAGETGRARALVQSVLTRFPGTEGAASAAFLHADLDHDAGRLDEATQLYRKSANIAPQSDEGGLSRMRLAGIAFAAGDYAAARAEYVAYLGAFPNGRRAQQAMYWNAQAAKRLGLADSAKIILRRTFNADPFSYYGGLAADELGHDYSGVKLAASPPVDPAIEAQVANALARVDLLREIGWDEAATTEMNRTRTYFASVPAASYSLAEALNERGFTSNGITLGWDIYRREGAWNGRLLRIIYPFPYQKVIVAEARERGVDPYLAAGLIRQESMFNPRATSGAGAMGLMQVMPATGKTLATALKVRKFSPPLLYTPDVNIRLGMAYLADQLRTWNNRPARVLAAYNAGPTRVQRWSQFPEWSDDGLFTERIPYTETRDYVKIVQQNARMYEALYGPDALGSP